MSVETSDTNLEDTMSKLFDDVAEAPFGFARPATLTVALVTAALTLPTGATAQEAATPACQFNAPAEELPERASPPDSSSIAVDGGVLKICYSSPRMRDREIMGELVPFGQPWRLGANEPTTLHVTTAVTIGDAQLEPGAYALYAIPGPETWQIVVNSDPERWGIPINDEVRAQDVGSIEVPAESVEEAVENFEIELHESEEAAAELVMTWEQTRVRVPVTSAGGA
ncbi:MAG: DUF2911 domain-containing protein [Gemmatimonadota bacterium]